MRKSFAALIIAVTLLFAASPLIFVPMTGCSTSQQRQTINTLFTTAATVDSAYRAFLDGVISGQIPTNSVPSVSARYAEFQSVLSSAIALATLSSNSPPSPEITAAAANVASAISVAKSGKKPSQSPNPASVSP